MKPSDFQIQHECPQCGAPAVLEETDRLFHCEYCRVRSYLLPKSVFRYILPHNAPEDKEIIYIPYWRFKGSLFSCFVRNIEEKFADLSHLAADIPELPTSLGLRTQALKLRFLSPDIQARFIRPTLQISKVSENLRRNLNESLGESPLYQEFIGHTISMIYAPFYVADDIWYDAVLNTQIPLMSGYQPNYSPPDSRIRFMPALCPNCGWDLDGDRNALTLTCTRCQVLWYAEKEHLTRLHYAAIDAQRDDHSWLPFWRIKAQVSGVRLDSYADMIRLANLPKVVQTSFETMPFYFWIPAFKVFPSAFLRLARSMISAQPQEKLIEKLPDGMLHSVTLSHTEAVRSLKIHLAGMIRPQTVLQETLEKIGIKAISAMVVYVPFQTEGNELIQPDYCISVHKNLLALSGNI